MVYGEVFGYDCNNWKLMKRNPSLFIGCLLIVLQVYSGWAAPSPTPLPTPTPTPAHTPTPTPKPPIVYSHFRVIAWMTSVPNLSYSQILPTAAGFKLTPISDDPRFRSPFYAFDKSKPVYLLQSKDGTIGVLATLDLSQYPDLPLILVQTNPAGETTTTIYPDDLKSFPAGSYRLINFAGQPVDAKFDDVDYVVAPNDSTICVPTAENNHVVQFQVIRPDTKKRVYSNLFTHSVSARWIFFFVEDSNKQISFFRLSDSAESAKAPTPTPSPTPTPTPTPKKKHHTTN
jgi:hypothetical protein